MTTGSGNGWPGVIKVPAQTTGDEHDPFCQRDEPDHWCECALIRKVRADEAAKHPRVQIHRSLGEPSTCKVWFDGRLLFAGVDHSATLKVDGSTE